MTLPIALIVVLLAVPLFAADLNVRDFGAKGDGSTDDTAAFQKALDTAGREGGRVNVPAGKYAIKAHLSIPADVTLNGTFDAPPRSEWDQKIMEKNKGSILFAYEGKGKEDGPHFIMLHNNSHLRGMIVFYPEQKEDDIQPFPWCVRGSGDDCTITATLLVNPWQAVDFGTEPCGRHYINGLYAQALKTGLFIDKCFDVGRVENIHFWPFWRANPKMEAWEKEHGTAFLIGRTDWEYVSNCFCIWYKIGYHFVANKDGPGNTILLNSGSDIGPLAVKIEQLQDHAGVSFVNGQFMSTVEVAPENRGPVKFTACGFWGTPATAEHARLHGQGNVTFDNCHFTGWANSRKDAPCIVATAGGLTINACEFFDADKGHIELGEGVQSAIVVANRFRSPAKIINKSRGDVQIGLNTGGTAK